ncbi:thymidylate kinase [Humidesulfovibrio mexicanus]|jgi:dTMP kinase|uniref:Thymidylate kinase n=1 Tax=Humidesulfovibrio mexicanus TaxID=147047 RepID=A0A238ZE15_9BACT|nr:dTMP kinase [Humidesulfovibrio mexicanus]SNR81238.1 thymidylate kinase [Humidesulfovibrio mexicanus]
MFITFEGIEGTGKSTQITLLKAHLETLGRSVLVTCEPGGSRIGRELRRVLLSLENSDLCARAELFLYLADRAQHVAQVVRPALQAGQVVLCDRFADSTVAYQAFGRGLDADLLHSLNELAVAGTWPDLTILLDIDPRTGLERAMARNAAEGKTVAEGRFEAESLAFHQRVREGYAAWAARFPQRIRLVEAKGTPEDIALHIRELVEARLNV